MTECTPPKVRDGSICKDACGNTYQDMFGKTYKKTNLKKNKKHKKHTQSTNWINYAHLVIYIYIYDYLSVFIYTYKLV